MDPNACFQRILDAMEEQDAEEFVDAFQDLADWLANGGFSPNVQSLGKCKVQVGPMYGQYHIVPRRTLSDRPFKAVGESHTIQTVDPNSDQGPYEFITYRGDERVARYLLT